MQRADKALSDARLCLQLGHFARALMCATQLERDGGHVQDARLVAWIARVYLGGRHHEEARGMGDVLAHVRTLSGGCGLAEAAWLTAEASGKDVAAQAIQAVLACADRQHGVLVSWHPTALLGLAELALGKLDDADSALLLANLVLGWQTILVSLEDANRLARLLVALRAPTALWTDWAANFIQHMTFATARPGWCRSSLDGESERWAREQDAASEGVLRSVIEQAPRETLRLLMDLAPYLDAPAFAEVLGQRFSARDVPGVSSRDVPGPTRVEPAWFTPRVLRYRYFWYDMINESEQAKVRNGDWAMFETPTDDFSMGLAQWWRTLESVLKRSIFVPISRVLSEHPEWEDWDRANLPKTRKEREKVFIETLSRPERAAKATLGDVLLCLQKCESTAESGAEGSRLRLEAARILAQHRRQIGPLTAGTWLRPSHLTTETINLFRNRSSHDDSADLVVASTGRVLARRILDGFFRPALAIWGFVPEL